MVVQLVFSVSNVRVTVSVQRLPGEVRRGSRVRASRRAGGAAHARAWLVHATRGVGCANAKHRGRQRAGEGTLVSVTGAPDL